jgi:hypothetical protein
VLAFVGLIGVLVVTLTGVDVGAVLAAAALAALFVVCALPAIGLDREANSSRRKRQ